MITSYPKEKINVLLLEGISAEAEARFREAGYPAVVRQAGALTGEALADALRDVHILGIRSKTRLSGDVLAAAPRLLAVGCFCIGTNQVDKHAAALRGIPVFNAPYSNTRSVAELVIGAAIMLIRRAPDKNAAAHKGLWLKDARGSHELRGRTLGIIGYGNIGAQVSVLAEALGMRVLYYDIEKKLPLGNAAPVADIAGLTRAADIITLHVPATPLTHGMVNETFLAGCRQGAILINYARGEVMDEAAIAAAISSGQLSGAAADVFSEEPESSNDSFSSPLQGLPNVLLTPHIGGSTEEAQTGIAIDVSSKLVSFLGSGSTQGAYAVPPLSLPLQEGAYRILHMHHNMPGVLSAINSVLSEQGLNILGQYLKTSEETGYVVLDVDRRPSDTVLAALRQAPHTIRVRAVFPGDGS